MKELTHARTAVYNVGYHFVWCVKYRRNVLTENVEIRLKELFLEVAEDKGFIIKTMEIMPDHIHIFASAHPKYATSYLYKMLKSISGRKLFMEFPELRTKLWKGKLWSSATYTETIGHISEETVKKYIVNQKKQ